MIDAFGIRYTISVTIIILLGTLIPYTIYEQNKTTHIILFQFMLLAILYLFQDVFFGDLICLTS